MAGSGIQAAAPRAELMAKAPKPLRRWRIILARQKGTYIGMVEAPDAEAAVEIGAKEYGYPVWRLIAEPIE